MIPKVKENRKNETTGKKHAKWIPVVGCGWPSNKRIYRP